MSRLFVVLIFIIGLGVGSWGALVMASRERPLADVEPSAEQVYVALGSTTSEHRQPARLALVWGESTEVLSGAVEGRVTAIAGGTLLEHGVDVVAVDGVWRPAVFGSPPLYRDLVWGSEGEDVDAVADLLVDLGYEDPGSRVRRSFVSVVREFEGDRGLEQTGVFKPSYVVWLPATPFRVGEWLVEVGNRIEAETPLAGELPGVTAADITASNDEVTLEVEGLGWVFDPIQGPIVELDGTSVVEPDRVQVADFLAGDTSVVEMTGVVRRADPVPLETVPTSAVMLDSTGTACVVLEESGSQPVEVVGGRGGISEILPLGRNERVLANPVGAECG